MGVQVPPNEILVSLSPLTGGEHCIMHLPPWGGMVGRLVECFGPRHRLCKFKPMGAAQRAKWLAVVDDGGVQVQLDFRDICIDLFHLTGLVLASVVFPCVPKPFTHLCCEVQLCNVTFDVLLIWGDHILACVVVLLFYWHVPTYHAISVGAQCQAPHVVVQSF